MYYVLIQINAVSVLGRIQITISIFMHFECYTYHLFDRDNSIKRNRFLSVPTTEVK